MPAEWWRSWLEWWRFEPRRNPPPSKTKVVREAAAFLGSTGAAVAAAYDDYRLFYAQQDYAARLGEGKTLCFEEAFIVLLLMDAFRPATIVEIGTQYGRSTRRIIDGASHLGLAPRIVCFDISEDVKFFTPDEAQIIIKDITATFVADVLHAFRPGLIFLDARPYELLKAVITGTLAHAPDCVLAIHDCARGLYNPRMRIARDDLRVTSATGVWERHVLAEVFDVRRPGSAALDAARSATHRLRIFGTPHGLGVIRREARAGADAT